MIRKPYDIFVFPGKITASSLDYHFNFASFGHLPRSLDIYALVPSQGFVRAIVIRLYELHVSRCLIDIRL